MMKIFQEIGASPQRLHTLEQPASNVGEEKTWFPPASFIFYEIEIHHLMYPWH